ncbi:XVIPCD domain-containing protein [Dyella sp. GSA-30]|uniref:XVIPCD domain-containing protein n=1 Tax=Dyella sp. GSA-30 TaxID=2994496 RepID=UPI0024913CE7|nr:XVIPCD domain-containing protein [Dyella sp. GSA-30]BDU21718.1 hypothetical protein DYGSA30_31750 [Dyella sp. GSA-30]
MPLHEDAQRLVDEFGRQPGVSATQLQNLQQAINASPALIDEINQAVAGGHLTHIMPETDPHMGGSFNPDNKTMNLQLGSLTPAAGRPFESGEVTFVLGHELQHSLNGPTIEPAEAKFSRDVEAIARSPGPNHDYTAAVQEVVAANRRDEAGAEISGWNAIASAARQDATAQGKPLTLEAIYNRSPERMQDFIDVDRTQVPNTYAIKPNLALRPDMSMEMSAHNIEGMGKNFFDQPRPHPFGLGQGGNADYQNYYGAVALGEAAQNERFHNPPQAGVAQPIMQVNMHTLRMNPQTVQDVGMYLGNDHTPVPYQDTGTQPPTARQFTHTTADQALSPLTRSTAAADPQLNEPTHPNNALFNRARDAVYHMDAQEHRASDRLSDNLAGAITVEAAKKGMTDVHSVHLSDDKSKVYAVQGDPNSPLKQMAEVSTVQAVNTSIAQSTNAINQVTQQHAAQGQSPSQQQNQQATQPEAQQASGGMHH